MPIHTDMLITGNANPEILQQLEAQGQRFCVFKDAEENHGNLSLQKGNAVTHAWLP